MPYIKQATRSGSIWCDWGGVFDGSYPTSGTRRGRVTEHGQICPTITASNQEVYRIMPYMRNGSGYAWLDSGGVFNAAFLNFHDKGGRVIEHGQVCPSIIKCNREVYRLIEVPDMDSTPRVLFNIYPKNGQAGNVYDASKCGPCLPGFGAGGGGKELKFLEGDKHMVEHNGSQYAIRKLTPRECLRLMGWRDVDIDKILNVVSNTQAYKQAGNGIVVDIIRVIGEVLKSHVTTLHLTELFGGIGCQRRGFVDAGIDVVSEGYVDFDKYATKSYNAVWDENYEPTDITTVKAEDLYSGPDSMWSYSFPCTDLSCAGRMRMMSRDDYLNGNGTRSGLLWEVERLLREKVENGEPLPTFLLMENVPQVHGKKNAESWSCWLNFLESIGYHSTWKDLNAREYGVAQNRNRTFMLSSLEPLDWFEWPDPIPLTTCMADYLDDEVEDKYYINNERADQLIRNLIDEGRLDDSMCK